MSLGVNGLLKNATGWPFWVRTAVFSERQLEVRQCKNRGCGESCFQLFEGQLVLRSPSKRIPGGKFDQRGNNRGVILDESLIKTRESQEAFYSLR